MIFILMKKKISSWLSYPSTVIKKNRITKQSYLQGVFWILIASLISNMNDILMRLIGLRLPCMEVAFFRFFFAVLTLLPIMIYHRKTAFKTSHPILHGIRALFLFGAISSWCAGVNMIPLATVSTLALTVPIFILPMAVVFLRERVGRQRILATVMGFVGILVVIVGNNHFEEDFLTSIENFNLGSLYMIIACLLFALSDIINKKMLTQESQLSMMFYIAIGTTLFGTIPAYVVWVQPTLYELFLLLGLGAGANLILFFLLKAFAATDVSALSPYRYLELFSASAFGYFIFKEIPSIWNLLGIIIIVPSTFAIAYYESFHLLIKKRTLKKEFMKEKDPLLSLSTLTNILPKKY